MTRSVNAVDRSIDASISIPGSKSMTNRALVCAALATGESVLLNASDSDDTALMINGLNQLGILVRKDGRHLRVEGRGGKVYSPRFPIPVGNAGTTLRFLMGVAALADGTVVFEGGGRMSERPIDPLVEGLRQLGVECESVEFAARYAVKGGGFRGGTCRIESDISSQFVSSILMVAPYASEDVRIETEGKVVSESYIRMTLEVMERFQVKAAQPGDTLTVRCGQCYKPATFKVEPDFSAASVFLCAAMTTGGTVRVGLDPENSIQGDAGIIAMLSRMGGTVERTPGELVFSGVQSRNYQGVTLDMRSTPDLVPALVSVLLFAETPSHLLGVGHLRFKESDRLDVLAAELRKTGADITVREDSIEICPVPLHGATLNPHSDHRLAMSFAVVGLRVPGIRIDNPGCVRKSFPGFWTEFGKLESHVAQSRGSNEG